MIRVQEEGKREKQYPTRRPLRRLTLLLLQLPSCVTPTTTKLLLCGW